MIETFKDRTKKSYITATLDENPSEFRKLARHRFHNRAFVTKMGYVKGDLLFLSEPESFDYRVRVAFTKKEA